MRDLKEIVMDTSKDMIGRKPDYQVREYVLGWMNNGVFTLEDVQLIDAAIEEQYAVPMEELQPAQ